MSNLGLYSPVPQAIDDSDSCSELEEEEAEAAVVVRVQKRADKMNDALVSGEGEYDEAPATGDAYYRDGPESVSILSVDNKASYRRMSPPRKALFLLSIALCLFAIVFFLWILPCSEPGDGGCSAPAAAGSKRTGWENPYHDVELKGPIGVVDGAPGRSKNLIMLFRGDVVNPERSEGVRSSKSNGIVSIVGDSGKVAWFVRWTQLPTDIDCSLVDLDKDGVADCLAIGTDGLLAAFDSLTGTIRWYLHDRDNREPFSAVNFPLVLADLDYDGVDDLLTSCAPYQSPNDNALVFVSGRSGSVIGTPLVLSECTSVRKLQMDKDRVLSFTCKNDTSPSESSRFTSFEDLYKSITNKVYVGKASDAIAKQHRRKEEKAQRNVYAVDNRRLTVENVGRCPKNCKVTVQLIDRRSGYDNVSWEYTGGKAYAMIPAILSFKSAASKSRISGFVLKFWQWNAGPKNANRFDRSADPPQRKRAKNEATAASNLTVNRLTERVVLVTFNATDVHVVNASQSDIVQLCFPRSRGDDVACQPDLAHQENSLAIADLDGDGSQELVTYLTSFVCAETASLDEYYGGGGDAAIKCDGEWKLRSTVRVVRLEAELPKLYEAVSHH